MDNLEALTAERVVLGILTGGLSELIMAGQKVGEAAAKAAEIVKSEDSNLSNCIKQIGHVYSDELDYAIRDVLQKLIEDYRAYVKSTVANEQATQEEVIGISSILKGISEGIKGISGR